MEIRHLKRMASASSEKLSNGDDETVCSLIDERFGSGLAQVVPEALSDQFPRLSLVNDDDLGLVLTFSARLRDRDDGTSLGWMIRRVFFDQHVAVHLGLFVAPAHRRTKLGTELLAVSVDSYDRWGIARITMNAGYDLGRWHWARLGFEFARVEAQQRVVAHARRVIERLHLDLEIDDNASPAQVETLTASQVTSLRSVASVSERFDHDPVLEAARNGFDIDAPMRLGQAVLLCGPTWPAELLLAGAGRDALEAYFRRRLGTP